MKAHYTISPAGNNRATEYALQVEYIFQSKNSDFCDGWSRCR